MGHRVFENEAASFGCGADVNAHHRFEDPFQVLPQFLDATDAGLDLAQLELFGESPASSVQMKSLASGIAIYPLFQTPIRRNDQACYRTLPVPMARAKKSSNWT